MEAPCSHELRPEYRIRSLVSFLGESIRYSSVRSCPWRQGHIDKGIHGTTYTPYTIISLGGRQTYSNLVALYGEIDVPYKFRGYVVRLRKALREPLL
jgi:hypothetical protein